MTAVELIPEQTELKPSLPTIEGNVDYRNLRDQLVGMDELLRIDNAEEILVQKRLSEWMAGRKGTPSSRHQAKYQAMCRLAVRCNVARSLLREDYRGFSMRLAESGLLQWFCGIGRIDIVRVPSKSTIGRFADWYSEKDISQLTQQIVGTAAQESNPLELEETIDLDCLFLDTTCLKANIHFPVDWVLLRDAVKTLMKALRGIRNQGLKHRMEEPETFVTTINRLSIQMTHCRGQSSSKKERKQILRLMKQMVKRVEKHARNYRALLLKRWRQTEWSYPQTQQVIDRIDNVLSQLPEAKRQAHERIIGERQVKNEDKILSLYEPEVNVLVRKKAGAEVEFGNGLLLAENPQGLILHWELFRESPSPDSKQLIPTVEAVEKNYEQNLTVIGGDRGFDTAKNRKWLQEKEVFNGLCPKNPNGLHERMQEESFAEVQNRRAQTEGRIGIFKNNFLGRPLRAKGYANRRMAVTWAALTHNLWVIARLPRKQKEEEEDQEFQEAPPELQAA